MTSPDRSSTGGASQRMDASWDIRCACGITRAGEEDNEAWIQCDTCDVWQHNVCMGISTHTEELPRNYQCERCAPDTHKELLGIMANGRDVWNERRKADGQGVTREEQPEHAKKQVTWEDQNGAHTTSSEDVDMPHTVKDADQIDAPSQAFPLTDECHHYTRVSEVPWDIQKYWHQRYGIFSYYDDGIHMTDDAWFGVTPEPVANKVAEDLAASTSLNRTVVIDMFAGAGGNAIAFALSDRWTQVIAIEKDASVLACAQHNASIYGVSEKITWINADSFIYLVDPSSVVSPSKTVIFASPPWGGPGYRTDDVFDLYKMEPYSLKKIYEVCKEMDCALYLPRTSDLRQIAKLAPKEKKIDVVQYCMEGASKALVAYIPAVS